MRVIGMDGQGNYIATVSHTELEKCADKYYGNLPKLSVGDTFDLGKGHDFRRQIVDACRAMTDAHRHFSSSTDTMKQFAFMVTQRLETSDANRAELQQTVDQLTASIRRSGPVE